MGLKDLVSKRSEVSESVIEQIISKYVRYYIDSSEISFTAVGGGLSNENKVLVYLAAILGWRYVTDAPLKISTKPASLATVLRIPGGSLRPLLKNLKDRYLVMSTATGYAIREENLEVIAEVVSGKTKNAPKKIASIEKSDRRGNKETPKSRAVAGNPISVKIDGWIKSGFFRTPRTLSAVLRHLHEQGVIARRTSVSKPLLKAVQAERLSRRKSSGDGKPVWSNYLPTVTQ